MCGIVAAVGAQNCVPMLMNGLQRLAYRGYDSAGVAVHTAQGIKMTRAVGKLAELEKALKRHPLCGPVGIGHTRWATHGAPSERNAHPHRVGDIVLVHNGIVENHAPLRRACEARGMRFASDTDTEVLVCLIDEAKRQGALSLVEAVRRALQQVQGTYAVAVMDTSHPDELVVAKDQSSLVLGVGKEGMFASSDLAALLPYTQEVVFLEDRELAVLRRDGYTLSTLEGAPVERGVESMEWAPMQAEKNGHKHFMHKEIWEQPHAVEATLRGRMDQETGEIDEAAVGLPSARARTLQRVFLLGCGTSYHAALVGRYWIEQLARVQTTVELASEVRGRDPVFHPNDLVLALSQSGETLDTLSAIKTAKAHGAHVLAIVNVAGSAIAREADGVFTTQAGPEIGVASTKCFTTQLVALLLLALHLGRCRNTIPAAEGQRIVQALGQIPAQMRQVLKQDSVIRGIARRLRHATGMLFLGRGLQYPIALEGALKVKEIAYIYAEGYAAGEMKHGPIALIDSQMPVIALCPHDNQYDKMLSSVQEVRARGGNVVAIITEGDQELQSLVDAGHGAELPSSVTESPEPLITLPETAPELLPLLTILPLQLLAYALADLKGTDIDQPRNLAKTVTVE